MAVLTNAKTLRVCGLSFSASVNGGWRCGCVVLRYLTAGRNRGSEPCWLASAPGLSTRGPAPEDALRQLRARAAAVLTDTRGAE